MSTHLRNCGDTSLLYTAILCNCGSSRNSHLPFCHEFSRPHCAEGQKRSSNSRFQAASISPLLGPLSCNYILSVPTFTTRILLTDHCRCARSIVERLSTVRWPDHAWLKALTGLYYSLLYGGKPKMRLRAVDSSIPSNRAFNLISFGAFLLPDH